MPCLTSPAALLRQCLFSLQKSCSSPQLLCQPCLKCCPRALVSSSCIRTMCFPTLSTPMYPTPQGYLGHTQSPCSRELSQSHQDKLKIWIDLQSRSILSLGWEMWTFHPSARRYRAQMLGDRHVSLRPGGQNVGVWVVIRSWSWVNVMYWLL